MDATGFIELATKGDEQAARAGLGRDADLALALLRALLDSGADPNGRQNGGYTALHEAAFNGNSAMIRLLLERGANPGLANDEGKLPADLAKSRGHSEAERLLVIAT